MKITVLLPLILVVAVSGCSTLDGLFGSDVIRVQERSIEEGTNDILVIREVHTIPTSPILPDQEVVFSFIIENQDKLRKARNVVVDLFNAPGFRTRDGLQLCNSGPIVCLPESNAKFEMLPVEVRAPDGSITFVNKPTIRSILPGEEYLVQYTLRSPSQLQIANIRTQARLDFKVQYDFENTLNFVVPVVNKEEVIRRQREGESINMFFDKSFSSGPVRIDVDTLGANFVLDDFQTILMFELRNVGSGTILNSQIPMSPSSLPPFGQPRGEEIIKGMEIFFPLQLDVEMNPRDVIAEIFVRNGQHFFNANKEVQIFRDRSQTSLRFPIRLEPTTLGEFRTNSIPYRSYEIVSRVGYTYELRNGRDITINPFENV